MAIMETSQRSSIVFNPGRGGLTGLVLVLGVVCLSACTPEAPPDYDLYENIRTYAQQTFEDNGATARNITDDFNDTDGTDYIVELSPLFRLAFGGAQLEVHLYANSGGKMATAAISQFEVPPNSGNFTDAAFVVRPNANLRAPFVHGDALKAMAGMDGSFSMDFYTVDNETNTVDVDEFFGDELETLQEALALVEPYQRKEGEGRGKYTKHLVSFKSQYRIEIQEPDTDDENERKAYFDAALGAFQLFMDAYFVSLDRLEAEDDEVLIQGSINGTDYFIDTLYEEDFAATMGKELFGEDFDDYFLKGFWRDGKYYSKDAE